MLPSVAGRSVPRVGPGGLAVCGDLHDIDGERAASAPNFRGKQFKRDDAMRTRSAHAIRITHRPSGQVIAEGPVGFRGITPFEGNLYISRKYLKTDHLRPFHCLSTGRS